MAKKRETTFKEKAQKRLNKLPNFWMCKNQPVAIRGIPDISFIVNGVGGVWELKKSGKEGPDALQLFNLRRAAKAGGIARLVSPENFDECFKELELIAYNKKPKRQKASDCWLCRSNRVLRNV